MPFSTALAAGPRRWRGGSGSPSWRSAGDIAAVLSDLKLGSPFIPYPSVDNAHLWEPSPNQPSWLEQMLPYFMHALKINKLINQNVIFINQHT